MSELEGSWQPDPFGRHEYRWYDGRTWTDQVSDQGVVATDPPVPAAPAPAPGGGAASGSNTVPMVIAGLAVVALVAAALVYFLGGDDEQAVVTDTTTTTAAETTTTEDGPDPAARLLLSRLLDDADLTDEERQCFSEGFLDAFGGDLAPLLAGAQGGDADPQVESEVQGILDRCGIDPTAFGGVAAGFPGLGTGGTVSGPDTYGDDPTFDALWDACEAGDGQACDDLYWQTPVDSAYEEFGATCGGRFGFREVQCTEALG